MTAIKQTTVVNDSLSLLRNGTENRLKTAASSMKSGLVQLKTANLAEMARSSAKGGWSRFQEARNEPIGKLLQGNRFGASNDQPQQSPEPGSDDKVVSLSAVREVTDDPHQAVDPIATSAVGPEPDTDHDRSDGVMNYMPITVIVSGLVVLCMLAVLTTGPGVDSEKQLESQAVAMSVPAAPKVASPSESAAPEKKSDTRIVVKPIQLAANISPTVFENQPDSSALSKDREPLKSAAVVTPKPAQTKAVEASAIKELPTAKPDADAATNVVQTPRVATVAKSNLPETSSQDEIKTPALDSETTEQLQMLQGENERLKEMMAELESETLDLNSELLQLELSLAEASDLAEPRQVVETRTVYNFVNVPLGGDVEQNSNAEYQNREAGYYEDTSNSNYVDNSYGNDQYPVNDDYIMGNQQGFSNQALVADMPAPEMGWSPDGQLMPPNHQLYRDDATYLPASPEQYFDPQGPNNGLQTDQTLYGNGADIQYGPAPQPVDLRSYPPVN